MKPPALRELLLLAYLDGLARQSLHEAPLPRIRLDDTTRPPTAAPRPPGGPRG